jgi:DNA-binding protein Fis
MDIKKTKEKLHKLNDEDLETLYDMVLSEKDNNRMTYMSNTTHTPNEQCKGLQNFFAQAWIHGH